MRSIRTKLALLVVAAVGSAVLLASLVAAWSDLSQRFASRRHELRDVAAIIATTLAQPLSEGRRDTLARALTTVGRIPGLTFARVTDAKGDIVEQFGFGVVVAGQSGVVEPNAELSPFSATHLATYPIAVPIVSGGNTIGELALIADLSPLRGEAAKSVVKALGAGAIAMLLGLVLSWRLQRRIVAPVASLTQAMLEVSRTKDFSATVPRASNDEIGTLVDAFNGMLAEVRERDAAIARHAEHLESEVEARTVDLVAAKLAAEAAAAARSDFLATMSHEIRTPMNGMLVMAELMATSDLPPRMQRNAEVLLGSGRTLLALLNDILDFSKIEAGKLELECVPVAISDVIDHVLCLFGERAAEQALDLAAHVAADVPASIAADPVRLTQILSNLVNNALKFTERGGVAVRARCAAQTPGSARLVIDVADTGIGIAADKQAAIFDAFTQADASTTRRFGGTGIGLAICRRLVDAMGGTIAITSAPGAGTTFTVTIPVEVLQPATAPLSPASGERRVVIALHPSPTRDALVAYVAERGLESVLVPPGSALAGRDGPPRAYIARAADLLAVCARERGIVALRDGPILIALAGLGDTAGDLGRAADRTLELPLATGDVAACFDAVVLGRRAVAVACSARPARDVDMAEPAFAGLRVLAADDNAVNREVLTEALAKLGASVVCVEDGAAAFDAVRVGAYDLVLMDCSMPVMDGFDATRAIRAWEHAADRQPMPVVALTAHVVGAKATSWRDAGMTDYLTKPYTLRSLGACLGRSLPRWQPRDAASAVSPPPAKHAAPAPPLIDIGVLADIRDIDTGGGLLAKVAALYAMHAPRALAALEAARVGGLPVPIADAAHALKSLSRNVGAERVALLCEAIEGPARHGDLSNIGRPCDDIAEIMPQTLEALAMAAGDGESSARAVGGGTRHRAAG